MQSAFILMFALILLAIPTVCEGEGGDSEDNTTSDRDSVEVASNHQLFIGAGLSFRFDDVEDFKMPAKGDSTLCINMDSRFRPSLITGTLFRFGEENRWNILVSVKFDIDNKAQFLDGLLLGVGWSFKENVALTASYDLRLGRELNPHFRREAASLVKTIKSDPSHCLYPQYKQYKVNGKGDSLIDKKQFDGFPLHNPENGKLLGGCCEPLIKSYNSALHIGLIFARTVDLEGLFPPE